MTSTVTCPNGHTSGDPEWCDTCGAPMAGPSASAAAASSSSAAAGDPAAAGSGGFGGSGGASGSGPVPCPHCGVMNPADNLFCESCGYDFTTGQAPEPVPAAASGVVPSASASASGAGATADPGVVDPGTAGGGAVAPSTTPAWVVIVEVDATWHSIKGELADRPLPPASTSTVPLFQHTSLIGRTSQSRGLRPEIALDTDTAVSRRHAQLIVEGDQLSVVDLSSTNGTYVLAAGASPTEDEVPLASGVSTALADGSQVYVGAWSRLTVRRT